MNYGTVGSAPMTSERMMNGAIANASMVMANREQVKVWANREIWQEIDKAVDEENQLKVAARFISPYLLPGATSALRGIVNEETRILSIPQSDMMPLIEISVQFALTTAQVNDEAQSHLGVTLAHRAGALEALAEDLVIFQGKEGLQDPVFKIVQIDGSDAGIGLLNAPPPKQVIKVPPIEVNSDDPNQNKYGENTFGAIAGAVTLLQEKHYGRCAVVLHQNPYADTYAAEPETLAVPADRIKGLVSDYFYSSSGLPQLTGLVVAIDGDTMDLVIGQDPLTEFTQVNNSQWIFRLYERFGLRLKDQTAVVRLEFQKQKEAETGEE